MTPARPKRLHGGPPPGPRGKSRTRAGLLRWPFAILFRAAYRRMATMSIPQKILACQHEITADFRREIDQYLVDTMVHCGLLLHRRGALD